MPNWTDEQLNAIDENKGALLVSAAAGSGKTAVLVERVIRRLTDKLNPTDIDRFLLVTYTNAAASEMRSKIALAMTKKLALEPNDTRLRRQLMLIHKAQITTVHSFCLNIIREQCSFIGLNPDFRIADEGEVAEIKQEAIEIALENGYESSDKGFLLLSDLLSVGRDDKRLSDVVLEIFDKIQSHADPDEFLSQVEDMFIKENGADIHKAILLEEAKNAAQYGLECIKIALSELETEPDLQNAYQEALTQDLNNAITIINAINAGWENAINAVNQIKHARLGAIRGYEDKDFQDYIKNLRDEWKTNLEKIKSRLICQNNEEHKKSAQLINPAMKALIYTVRQFADIFAQEKLKRNAVDFNDLEHFAVKLLVKDGKPTPLAHEIASGFDEIMVDEYQDSNSVQETIFNAVSQNGQNLFFVGDVKQSIYGFRLANPYIFLEKYQSWDDKENAKDGKPRKLNLTRNFRSREQVLEATNYIFKNIMRKALGDLDYTEKEALYTGADYPNPEDERYKTEVILLDTQNTDDDAPEKTMLEAQMVAKRIKKLLDDKFPIYDRDRNITRDIMAGDIVILLRSINRKAFIFRKALEQIGLSAETDETSGLLSSSEVSSIISILHIIDNPRQDVELIGALRSPLIGFNEQELADMRVLDKKAEFYELIKNSAEQGNQKVIDFLNMLDNWRKISADLPVCTLIQKIFEQTNAMGVFGAMPNGKQRQQNLLAFFERARIFEKNSTQGLFRFTSMLRGMAERGEDWQAVQVKGGGAVKIMSIHKSKGLEFPVVIVADCAKKFNEQDLKAPILVHPELGLGPKCRDIQRMVQYPTIWRQAITVRARREAVSEELRVLYVALTRAKEKLIITASSARLINEIKKLSVISKMSPIPTYPLTNMNSYLPWILLPLLKHPKADNLREQTGTCSIDVNAPDVFDIKIVKPQVFDKTNQVVSFENLTYESIKLDFDLPEKSDALKDIPAKLTATGLKEGFKAHETSEDTTAIRPNKNLRQPDFTQKLRGLTPAEKGTAHHLFMQFCDFKECEKPNGVKNELMRLRDMHILSNEQANAIKIERIENFFKSKLYAQEFTNSIVKREFKFSVVLPASDYYPQLVDFSDEKVLLQGVIDCLLETDEGFTVIDFKTDRVRGSMTLKRAEEYKPQLLAYAQAVEQVFRKKVKKTVLYFLNDGQTVETII